MLTPSALRQDGPSTAYYRSHPEARRKKVRTQAEINKRPEERKRRAALNRERRKRGIAGKGGPDISHTSSGKTVLESPSTNRARNGHGNNPRYKSDAGVQLYSPVHVDPARRDAPESAKGQPCGASHIPKQHKCTKGKATPTNNNLKTAAKVALAAGVLAGGAYLVKRRLMSMEEWRNSPQSASKNPKLTEEENQRIVDEAIAGGQVWDVQEKINARRRAERITECGGGLGKIQAPAKFDAAVPRPRCQAGAGAFGTYFVHNSGEYGVKLYRDPDSDVGWEFERLDRAHAGGVNVPEPLRTSVVRDIDGEVRAQTMTLRHMRGYVEAEKAYPSGNYQLDNAPLIIKVKAAREFRKLHAEYLAHGDIHAGNVMVDPRSKRVALVDFGYSTRISDSRHPEHSRDGIENLRYDLQRLPQFLGLDSDDFLERNKGVVDNVLNQARNLNSDWEKYDVAIKRYHDALETDLLWDDRKPRSRFISGADQPRIPGLTRRILTANMGTPERKRLELIAPQGKVSEFRAAAKGLGVKPARLFLALKPERQARLKQPFGTPILRPSRPIIRGRLAATPTPPAPPAPKRPAIKVKRNPLLGNNPSPGPNTQLKAQMYRHWSAGGWRWKRLSQKGQKPITTRNSPSSTDPPLSTQWFSQGVRIAPPTSRRT